MTRTAKPAQLYKIFLQASSLPGELVVDPFCGTDPLAKAAAELGRRWASNDSLTVEEVMSQTNRRHHGKRGANLAKMKPILEMET